MSSQAIATGPIAADPIEFLVQRIANVRATEGTVSADMVQFLAQSGGVSLRQAQRWVARGSRQRIARDHAQLSNELKVLYFEMAGSVSRTFRQAATDGIPCPSRPTLQRLISKELTAAERAYAKHGEHARRANLVYLKKTIGHRNAVWETDHKQLGVKVIPPRGSNPIPAWITTFMDAKHRLIVGVSISLQPTTADVLAAFRTGVRRDPDISPAYGAPDEVHWDNGKEFLSDAVTEVAVTMGVLPRALPAYAPHMKGKIERWHRTLDDEFLATLPQFQAGPRAANGRLYGSSSAFLSYDLLCEKLLAWIRHYNYDRPHSELQGLTPAQSWEQDPAMLREFSDDELRWMALPSTERIVNQDGIHLDGHSYIASELTALRGEKVEVRYMPHDHRSVDVYRDRKFICTAEVQGAVSAEEQQRLLADRKRQARKAQKLRGKASQQAKVRLASVTGKADPTDQQVTVINRQKAQSQGAQFADIDQPPSGPTAAPVGLNRPWSPTPKTSTNRRGTTKVSNNGRNET